MTADKNWRVLVIDDNRAIHDDFRKILCPANALTAATDATEAAVFGPATGVLPQTRFEVDSAYQGQEGVQMVQKALAAGQPYALAFVDVRMPPGWDGLETIQKIWELDPGLQVVFCSAYSDYSWSEMFEKLGQHDGWLILKKPFDAVEAVQLAHALTEKWWLHQQSRRKMEELEGMVAERTAELVKTNATLQVEIVEHKRVAAELEWHTAFLEAKASSTTPNSATDGILVVDPQGKKSFQNPRAVDLLKVPQPIADDMDDQAELHWVANQTNNPGQFVERVVYLYSHPDEIGRDELAFKDGTILDRYTASMVGKDGKYFGRLWMFRDITERRRMEKTLRESEARYHALFDGSADGIVIADSETRKFRYANPALCRMLGYTEAELCSLGVADIHPPESLPQVAAEFEAQARGDKTLAADLPCLRKDGSIFHADITATKITIDGRPCNVGFFRDITERKRLVEQLRASEKSLNEAQRIALIGSWVWQNGPRFWSAMMFQLHGIPQQDESPSFERFLAAVHPDDRERVGSRFQKLLTSDRDSSEIEYRVVLPDGAIRTIAGIARSERDTDGRTIRLAGTCQDITERKREETALRMFQFASDNAADEIFWLDENARFYYVNDQACRSMGYTREELMRLSLFDIDPVFSKERWDESWRKIQGGQIETFRVESIHRRKDGSVFPIEVMAKHMCFGSLRLNLAITRDTTERKQMEESLRMFQFASDNAADEIWWIDQNAVFNYVNDQACRSLGYTREELMRLNLFDIDPIFPKERWDETWKKLESGQVKTFRTESRHRRKDGSVFPIEVMAKHICLGSLKLLLAVTRDITERKQMEAELTYERDLLRTLLDQSPDDIYFKDAQSRFIKTSKAHARQFGVTNPDELVGRTDFDFFTEEHARPAFEDEQEIIRTGVPIIGKVEKEAWQDGRETWCLTTKMPFCDKDGKIIGTFGISKDITALKQIEHALAYERDLFQMLMDQSPDSIYFKDLQSRFMRFSHAKVKRSFAAELARHTAAHPDEKEEDRPAHLSSEERFAEYLVGKTDFDLFTEEHARPAFEDEQEIIRTGVPVISKVEKEVWLDGREAWVLTSKMPFRDKDGKIIGTFGVSKDITAMKQVEAQLRQLSRAVEQSPASILITDPAGNITYVNPKFTAITGYAFEEALGKNPRILKSGETPPEAYVELWRTITAGKEWNGQFHNKKKNGELYWEWASISPIFNAGGQITHFLAVKEDITERKRMEDLLFKSQKMETVGKLAGGVAHEFNSILTAIIIQSELLVEDLPPGGPLAQNAVEIRKAAERAATLTRQLLAYGRKQFLRPEILDLNLVIAGMNGMLRHLMGAETVAVKIIPAAGLHLVKADAGQMEQVIVNLALNARAAMPNGGQLTLETTNVTLEQESIGRYPELKPGSYVMLAVTDTGTGMSEEVKAHVFEPFFTTKDVGLGPGLGLSTCYGIIKQSGGHISVYSEPGRGTTFKIYLPQAPTDPASRPPSSPSSALPGGTETILLAEDDPALNDMAAALLRRLGYTVLTAANGVEALNVKQQPATGHIDLLLTDVVMPHMSGKELADRMRALYPHTRILFISAYTENASIQQGVLAAGVAFLQKPFTPSALAHKVWEVLNQPKP